MSAPLRPTSKRSLALALVLAAAVLVALGAYRVREQHRIVELGYELAEATAELREAREDNRRLRLELSLLTEPERIQELATEMGLAPASAGQIRPAKPAPDAGGASRAEPGAERERGHGGRAGAQPGDPEDSQP